MDQFVMTPAIEWLEDKQNWHRLGGGSNRMFSIKYDHECEWEDNSDCLWESQDDMDMEWVESYSVEDALEDFDNDQRSESEEFYSYDLVESQESPLYRAIAQ
jgi:hypothetical protein